VVNYFFAQVIVAIVSCAFTFIELVIHLDTLDGKPILSQLSLEDLIILCF
jgi:hypothetical protein